MQNLQSPELVHYLKQLHIKNSEIIFNLDLQNLLTIYYEMGNRVLTQMEQNWVASWKIPDEIHDKQLFRVYMLCKKMSIKIKSQQFQLSDLMDPDVKRTKQFLTDFCKFALFKQQMKEEFSETNHQQIQSMKDYEGEKEELSRIKVTLNEERENTKSLEQNVQQRKAQLVIVKNSLNSLQNSHSCFQESYDEISQRILDLTSRAKYMADQIYLLKENGTLLNSKIVTHTDEIQKALYLSEQSLLGYDHKRSQRQKQLNLEEFKYTVFQRFNEKIVKMDKNLMSISKVYEQGDDQQKEIHSLSRQIKLMENGLKDKNSYNQEIKEQIQSQEQQQRLIDEDLYKINENVKKTILISQQEIEQLQMLLNIKMKDQDLQNQLSIDYQNKIDDFDQRILVFDENIRETGGAVVNRMQSYQLLIEEQINNLI